MSNQQNNCKYYGSARGCIYGNNCRYSHSNPNYVRLCLYYDNCPFGNDCKFRHVDFQPQPQVHMNPNYFNAQYISMGYPILNIPMQQSTTFTTQYPYNYNYNQANEAIQTNTIQKIDLPAFPDDQTLKETQSSTKDQTQVTQLINQIWSHQERKQRSKLLVAGYIREFEMVMLITTIIPSDIKNLFHQYYFQLFEAKWCHKNKGDNMLLSENNTKITSASDHESCRGRDPICKGMIVEWYCNCYVVDGIGLGVVSSKNKNWNTSSCLFLIDAYAIDDCENRVYYGEKRHVFIEYEPQLYDVNYPWVKPAIKHWDASQKIKLVCDYKTNEFATLTYYFDGKVCKPSNQNYTFKLPKLENNDCWYMLVDFWNEDSWCKVSDH